jgi:hypothetical protein
MYIDGWLSWVLAIWLLLIPKSNYLQGISFVSTNPIKEKLLLIAGSLLNLVPYSSIGTFWESFVCNLGVRVNFTCLRRCESVVT